MRGGYFVIFTKKKFFFIRVEGCICHLLTNICQIRLINCLETMVFCFVL